MLGLFNNPAMQQYGGDWMSRLSPNTASMAQQKLGAFQQGGQNLFDTPGGYRGQFGGDQQGISLGGFPAQGPQSGGSMFNGKFPDRPPVPQNFQTSAVQPVLNGGNQLQMNRRAGLFGGSNGVI